MAAAMLLVGCGSLGRMERVGTAGASLALLGGATTFAATQYVVPPHPDAGRALQATGSALTVAGLLMCVYALDAILTAEAEADFGPSDAAWRREQRRRLTPPADAAP